MSGDSKPLINVEQRYGTVGWKEFLTEKQSLLNDYDLAKAKSISHPVQVEHGNAAERSFRDWLSNYLPRKYGVTSGFIIPDSRQIDYKLYHYDVIIYDALNAPTLWASDTHKGRDRAIPSQFVFSVLEVKATFNRRNIRDAIAKLKELNVMRDRLNKNFSSASIFFEVLEGEQRSSKVVGSLLDGGLYRNYGGLILRAQGLDANLSGYYQYIGDIEANHPATRPLVQVPLPLKRTSPNSIEIASGSSAEALQEKGMVHVNSIYAVYNRGVELIWSYNSFPLFASDILDRLEGIEITNEVREERGSFGMSYTVPRQ